ncbi:MAG: tetratricopeptide repeat protein [Flavobacteriales bacterium]|jgi:tetratricopeptide (TPR) repeat protein
MQRILPYGLGLTFLMLLASFVSPPKVGPDFGAKFIEANRLMEERFWTQAIKEWTALLQADPNNANINYKIGYCILQTSSSKSDALAYLEAATARKISKNYDPFDPTEKYAPVEALFYLGMAEHLNYKLDEAIATYEKVKKSLNKKHQLYARAERQIEMCEEAKLQVTNPQEYVITNVGPVINGVTSDFGPVLTIDEATMFFTSRRLRPDSTNSQILDFETNEFKEDVYVSFRDEENQWTSPELLNLNSDDHDATIGVSPDGQTLFIYRDSLGDGRILYSRLIGETWSDPAKLGSDINSEFWETHATITADGNTLYFVSNRPGGYGGRDIYRCVKLPNGEWSRALNVGPTINTKYDEDSPFLAPDGKSLYFASQGHKSMGGFDLFSSRQGSDGEWSTPENLGYPLNTVDDEFSFQPMADGRRAYYSSQKDGGYGLKDIYLVDMPKQQESQLAVLKGFIIGEEGVELPSDLKVMVTNMKTGERAEYRPRSRDGGYLAVLNLCTNYHLDYFQGRDVIKQDDIQVPCDNFFLELEREVYLLPLITTDSVAVEETVEETYVPVTIPEEPAAEEPKEEKKDLGYDPNDPSKTQFLETLGYAEFSRYFLYDSKDFTAQEAQFQDFLGYVRNIVDKRGKVIIIVEASASTVPSSRFKSNQELAEWRNRVATELLTNELSRLGLKKGVHFTFGTPLNLVQGKNYENDAEVNKAIYEQFQYIKIKVEG